MQTFLLRRTKGLANDQMRIMCAVIATIILIFGIFSEDRHITKEFSLSLNIPKMQKITEAQKTIQNAYYLTENKINENYDMTMMTQSSKDGFLFEQSLDGDITGKFLRESFSETIKCIMNNQRDYMQQKTLERKQLENIVCDPTDITKISNASKEHIALMVKDTWLEGKEDILYEIEHRYSINVFFMYSVSTLESEFGTSPRAKNRNNYYGLETMVNYGSFENNTEYWADMMNRLYVENTSIGSNIDDIGLVYCPPNPKWANIVSDIMMQQYKKIWDSTVA